MGDRQHNWPISFEEPRYGFSSPGTDPRATNSSIRRKLNAQVEEYLAKGNRITRVPFGESRLPSSFKKSTRKERGLGEASS